MKHILFAAHHPATDFITNHCNHYYSDDLSIAELLTKEEHFSEPFQHAHEPYEFLIPYGPIPMIMYMGAVYFGEVGYVYPVQSQKVHASKFRISSTEHDNVVIDKEYFEKILKETSYAGQILDGKFRRSRDLELYLRLFKSAFCNRNSNVIREERLKGLTRLVCFELIECAFQKQHNRSKEPWQYQKGMLSVASYINQHYREEIKIEDLARMAGLSKNYFISSFTKFMGESPQGYLQKLRVSYAKILLETKECSIEEIASLCGFRRSNTFSTMFKKETGLTPSQYKKQENENN